MKPKARTKTVRRKTTAPAPELLATRETTIPVTIEDSPFPPPSVDDLLNEAEQEFDKLQIHQYLPIIHTLRKKNFTFREIAKWLVGRGVEVNYNAVYRAYTRDLSEAEVADLDYQEDCLESTER